MPIMTLGGQKDENMEAALSLLDQGDGHLAAGNNREALGCYVAAADLVPNIPEDHAFKAGNLALETNYTNPQFENQRIAATFFGMVSRKHPNYLEANNKQAKAFGRIRKCWRALNLVPLPHIVCPGEGGNICVIELVWNSETPPHPKLLEKPDVLQQVKEYASQGHLYAYGINTIMDDDMFDDGEEFDLFWYLSAPMKAQDIPEWIKYRGLRNIAYISPAIRPMVDQYLDSRGIPRSKLRFQWKETPATAEWYRNALTWKFEVVLQEETAEQR